MKTSTLAWTAVLALCAAAPAAAVTQTWYLTGHIDPLNGGMPLDSRLAAAFADGASFVGSFSFNTTAPALELIPGSRTDFVTDTAHGGATLLEFADRSYSSTSSRLLTQYAFNGESLTLNANAAATGPAVAGLNLPGLDLLTLSHYGPPGATDAEKWPWFQPERKPSVLPDLSALPAGTVPQMSLFFTDPASGDTVFRIGLVTGLSLTPYTLPAVPEPANAALFGIGLALLGWQRRRPLRG